MMVIRDATLATVTGGFFEQANAGCQEWKQATLESEAKNWDQYSSVYRQQVGLPPPTGTRKLAAFKADLMSRGACAVGYVGGVLTQAFDW